MDYLEIYCDFYAMGYLISPFWSEETACFERLIAFGIECQATISMFNYFFPIRFEIFYCSPGAKCVGVYGCASRCWSFFFPLFYLTTVI